MADELILEVEAARRAKRAIALALLAVSVAIVVLVIDNSIKKSIVEEARKARGVLDEFRSLAEGVRDDARTAEMAGVYPGSDFGGGDDVVRDAPAGEILDEAAGGSDDAPGKRPSRVPRRPSGNG